MTFTCDIPEDDAPELIDPCERCNAVGTEWGGPYDNHWLCACCAYELDVNSRDDAAWAWRSGR